MLCILCYGTNVEGNADYGTKCEVVMWFHYIPTKPTGNTRSKEAHFASCWCITLCRKDCQDPPTWFDSFKVDRAKASLDSRFYLLVPRRILGDQLTWSKFDIRDFKASACNLARPQ